MEFLNNIFDIQVGGDNNFFRCKIGQTFGELEVTEIVHDRNYLQSYGVNRYYVVVTNGEEYFTWKVFDDCSVKVTLNK
jgi:hypothetical protein